MTGNLTADPRRVVVGPVNRELFESHVLQAAGATEFFCFLEAAPSWHGALVGPIADDAETEWLAARGVSLGVSTEAALERALRLRARCPTMSVDLGLHWGIAKTAALELRKLGCRVRLYGVDLGETYCSYGDLYYAEWRALGISEMVISVATDLAQEPFDWLLEEPRLHEEDLRMDDVRTEIELAGVPVLLSVRSSVRGALDFQRTYLPQTAGVFFGLGRDPDYGGHFPARVTLDELVG